MHLRACVQISVTDVCVLDSSRYIHVCIIRGCMVATAAELSDHRSEYWREHHDSYRPDLDHMFRTSEFYHLIDCESVFSLQLLKEVRIYNGNSILYISTR